MKFKDAIKRIKLYKQNPEWSMNDYFIEARNVVSDQNCPVDDENNKDKHYTCLRDFNGFSVYVPHDKLDDLLYNNKKFYNKEFNLINMSQLRRNKVKRNIIAQVYNNTSPAAVKLKVVEYTRIKSDIVYLVYTIHLRYDDDIYSDLLNYKSIEGKY